MSQAVGVRESLLTLQRKYEAGDKKPLEDLVRAWKGIQELPPDDPRSFFVLGGYHGEPFELRPEVDKLSPTDIYAYWGGYCHHGNVLFPTWHRVYVKKLEEALQSIVPGVMMPFWDETDDDSRRNGIPSILTQETFELDGKTIPNPLKSFVLPKRIDDKYWGDNEGERHPYRKPAGYATVRYPLSGLVGNKRDERETRQHNRQYPDEAQRTRLLNKNVRTWLRGGDTTPDDPHPQGVGVYQDYRDCLRAPNYTVFSNTTSAAAWNNAGHPRAVPLEAPHNDIHLAVGGFDLPVLGGPGSTTGQRAGANGDMGENNTAALDPIFFFHHCNVDRMFWLWQKQNGHTQKLDIIKGYAGTDSSASQGPTPGIPPGTPLDLKTPLRPFRHGGRDGYYISEDVIDIEKMGYTYGSGSLEQLAPEHEAEARAHGSQRLLELRGIDRALFQGSFVLTAIATITAPDGTTSDRIVGHHSVFSRYNVVACANCLTHLEVVAHFPLRAFTDDEVDRSRFRVQITHRAKQLPEGLTPEFTVLDPGGTMQPPGDAKPTATPPRHTSRITSTAGISISERTDSLVVAIPVFEGVDLLDFSAPCEIFSWLGPGAERVGGPRFDVYLVAATTDPVTTRDGIRIIPHKTFGELTEVDLLFVPGGSLDGIVAAGNDAQFGDFIKTRAAGARFVTSVCDGALLLANAGLLDGHDATTHWAFTPCLREFPEVRVVPGYPRFVVDRNRITGGGISAGLDECMHIVEMIAGPEVARRVRRTIQYFPTSVPQDLPGDPACPLPSVYPSWPAKIEEVAATAKTGNGHRAQNKS